MHLIVRLLFCCCNCVPVLVIVLRDGDELLSLPFHKICSRLFPPCFWFLLGHQLASPSPSLHTSHYVELHLRRRANVAFSAAAAAAGVGGARCHPPHPPLCLRPTRVGAEVDQQTSSAAKRVLSAPPAIARHRAARTWTSASDERRT